MAYATDTDVPVEKSRAEIERLLQRAGAEEFGSMLNTKSAIIAFRLRGKMVRFTLPLPNRNAEAFTHTPGRKKLRSEAEAHKAWEQGCRSRWRALCLCIKAKLEACETGITTFESEFLAHFVIPGGKTYGEVAIPALEEATKHGKMPQLMLGS
jgi:DNA repair photolyase